ncbi:MAG: NAD(P)/FAD-dependent oxidoreductase [Pseudomonadota bacterium]
MSSDLVADVDVIIIGAGAAGLSAAKELALLGLSYRVVEGSHRIGGRAYSEEIAPGVWFDLGCSYLHQGATNPFGPIADSLGIEINRAWDNMYEPDHIRCIYNGTLLEPDERKALDRYWEACNEALEASAGRGEDRAIADLVDMDHPFFQPFANSLSELNAMDIDETSAADFMAFGDDDTGPSSDIPVPGGYGNLVKAWGADVEVALNSRAEKINWSGPGVTVDTVKGSIRGRAALVTVSTGILAADHITFAPRLPDWKVEAFLSVPTGAANKICLHFDRDVFGTDGLGFYTTWNENGEGAGVEASANGNNTAIVFVGGRHAVWLEKQGQAAGHDHAVSRVTDVFGNDIKKRITRSIVTAWAGEPWTLGSYSAAKPGQAHQRHELAKPIDGRLFFAGEATDVGAHATCHGALKSGIRAAREIAVALG